jgi:hypothetical protein
LLHSDVTKVAKLAGPQFEALLLEAVSDMTSAHESD